MKLMYLTNSIRRVILINNGKSVTKVYSDRPGAIPLVYFIIIVRFDKRIQQRQPKLKLYKLFLSEKNGTEQMHAETC